MPMRRVSIVSQSFAWVVESSCGPLATKLTPPKVFSMQTGVQF
jgi:hypothetical protein